MERGLTILERLHMYAEAGIKERELNIYKAQIPKLEKLGFIVCIGNQLPDWEGQYRCKVSWLYSLPGTYAFELLKIAFKADAKRIAEKQN